MNKNYLNLFIILFSATINFYTYGANPIVLNNQLNQFGVRNKYLDIYEDPLNKNTINDVSSVAWNSRFKVFLERLPTNKNLKSTYWLRFTLTNLSSSDKKWILEFFDHSINYIEFYSPNKEGKFIQEKSGNTISFLKKIWHHKNLEFNLNIPFDSTYTFYVKIKSNNENVLIPEIRSYERFVNYALIEYYLLGIFYGILFIMAIYNFLLFIALKEINYLYYVCYVLSVILYTMCHNGLAFQFIWPNHPSLNENAFDIAIFLTMLFSVLFTKRFFGLEYCSTKYNNIINWILLVRALILLIGILFVPILAKMKFLDLIPFTFTYIITIHAIFKGKKISKYFAIAYSLVFITFAVSIFEQYGMLWSDIFTVYSINISIILDILFLSISLADKMRLEINMREDFQLRLIGEMKENEMLSQKVNRELEGKVAMRTIELNQANDTLKKQAEDITKMNLKLDLINFELKKNVAEISQKRIVKPSVDFNEFLQVYADTSSCYRFLEQLKSEKKYKCKKCAGATFGKGKEIFDRRCTKCGYNESITSNTIFHKLKFPIVKAFYITHLTFTKKEITAEELSSIISLRKETCSTFKKKVLERIQMLNKKELVSWDILILNIRFVGIEEDE